MRLGLYRDRHLIAEAEVLADGTVDPPLECEAGDLLAVVIDTADGPRLNVQPAPDGVLTENRPPPPESH